MRAFLIISFLIYVQFFAGCSSLQTNESKIEMENHCNEFMQNIKEEKIRKAMQLLKDYSAIDDSDIDSLEITVKKQLSSIFASRKVVSFQFINEKKISNCIIKRNYLLKFKTYFLRFSFVLYNNDTQWIITGFAYSEDVDNLYD